MNIVSEPLFYVWAAGNKQSASPNTVTKPNSHRHTSVASIITPEYQALVRIRRNSDLYVLLGGLYSSVSAIKNCEGFSKH